MKALLDAINENNQDRVIQLLNNGLNPNQKEQDVYPLFCAVQKGNQEIVKLLINAGASLNQKNYDSWRCVAYWPRKFTALHQAVDARDLGMIKILLEAGADYNLESGHYELSPLKMAIDMEIKEIVEVFLPFLKRDELSSLTIHPSPLNFVDGYKEVAAAIEEAKLAGERWSTLRGAWCGAVALASITTHGIDRGLSRPAEPQKDSYCAIS
jgi:ankyrin repeat protein